MHAHGRDGFTLIELLVVISIIALLIAILLPALSAVQSAARAIKCKSQIRSIAQATHLYFQDESEYLPPALIEDGVSGYPDGDIFSNMYVRRDYMTAPMGLDSDSPFRCPETAVEQRAEKDGGGDRFTETIDFMYNYPEAADPTGDDPQPIDGVAVPTWYMLAAGNHQNWTFRWIRSNAWPGEQGSWDRMRRRSALDSDSRRALAAEQHFVNAAGNWGRGIYGDLSGRHGPYTGDGHGTSHWAFFDGRVDSVRTEDWETLDYNHRDGLIYMREDWGDYTR